MTHVRKYAGGTTTPSLVTRWVLTLLILAAGGALGVALVRDLAAGVARIQVAALLVFLTGLWLLAAVVFLPYVWRPSAEWKRHRYEALRLERRLAASLAPNRRTDPRVLASRTAYCPACGQEGLPADARSRTRCSACLRPWSAAGTRPPVPGLAAASSEPGPALIDLREPARPLAAAAPVYRGR
jgi:hypothetical protein